MIKQLPNKLMNLSYVNDHPEYEEIYTCERFSNDFKDGIAIYLSLEKQYEYFMWCVYNCKGKFYAYSEWMTGAPTEMCEFFVFEYYDEAMLFRLTFGGETFESFMSKQVKE